MSELDDALENAKQGVARMREHGFEGEDELRLEFARFCVDCADKFEGFVRALDVRGRQVGELLGEIHRSVPDWVQARVEHYDVEVVDALRGDSDE